MRSLNLKKNTWSSDFGRLARHRFVTVLAFVIGGCGFSDRFVGTYGPLQDEIEGLTNRPIMWSVFDTELFVTTSDGRRSRAFNVVRPVNPYDGYTPPFTVTEWLRLAA